MAWENEANWPEAWSSIFFSPIVEEAGQHIVYAGGEGVQKFYKYNLDTNTWTELADPPAEIGRAISMSPDGTKLAAHTFGGTQLFIYTISANSWETSSAPPSAASVFSTVWTDNDTVWCQVVRSVSPAWGVKCFRYVVSTDDWTEYTNYISATIMQGACMSVNSTGTALYVGRIGANEYGGLKYVIADDAYSTFSIGGGWRFYGTIDRSAKLWHWDRLTTYLGIKYYDCDAETVSAIVFPDDPERDKPTYLTCGIYQTTRIIAHHRATEPQNRSYRIITAPSVTTDPATEVEEETAIGNGNITDTGGEDCDKRGICWNTTGNPTIEDDKSEETDPFGTGAFSRPITDLSPGTKYYVKAYAHNSVGYGYGGEESFTTKPNAPSNLICVVQSSSQIDVNWTKGTGATKTMVRRKVGSYPSDITDGDQAYYGTGNSFNDAALVRATHYYYRAWSWVEGGDIWSDDYAEDNAWTLIGAPAVTTGEATGRGAIAATLNGTLGDNGGEDCECGFQWGPDVNKDITTPTESKTTGQTFSQVIGGLAPNTTYHFRAFATNSVGTGYGTDRTFTTALIISRAFALAREEL